mgnify:CR=1 FL=1
MKKTKIFLPLTTDKVYWDFDSDMVFLNQVYCEQLLEEERHTIRYRGLDIEYPDNENPGYRKKIKKIAACLGKVINDYSGTQQSSAYWEKVLFRWLLYIVADIQVKMLQFASLKEQYPDYEFYTYSKEKFQHIKFLEGSVDALWAEDFHFWLYTYLAGNYYNIDVKFIESECDESSSKAIEGGERNGIRGQSGLHNRILRKCRRLKKLTAEELKAYWYRRFCSHKAEVLHHCLNISQQTNIRWAVRSKGKILPWVMDEPALNLEINRSARNKMTAALNNIKEVSPILAELLSRLLPRFYLEEYRVHHDASLLFLENHKNLRVIFSTTGILTCSRKTICSFLAQERGVKLIGQQHGGSYEILQGIFDQQEFLNDIFYSWAKKDARQRSSICEVLSGPSYKLQHYCKERGEEKNILFVGTTLFMYPRYEEKGWVDAQNRRYIQRQINFLSALSNEVQDEMCIREYYVDSGWHIEQKMAKCFPKMRFSGSVKVLDDYGSVDIGERDSSFAEDLSNCKLMICDHLSTTWREALYLDKPFIMLLDKTICQFREEALEYIQLMESAEIIFYDCEKAAALLNRIYKDVSAWWNEPERQKIVKKIQEDYLFEVEDIDSWWELELLQQARR